MITLPSKFSASSPIFTGASSNLWVPWPVAVPSQPSLKREIEIQLRAVIMVNVFPSMLIDKLGMTE